MNKPKRRSLNAQHRKIDLETLVTKEVHCGSKIIGIKI